MKHADFYSLRKKMVFEEIVPAGVSDTMVIDALLTIPRHEFVPARYRTRAYENTPLPIGHGQTISQPSLVGLMTQYLNPTGSENVLEIGTGCGYQSAILSKLSKNVYTVERIPELSYKAHHTFARLGITNIHTFIADGSVGLVNYAPFQGIIVTAAARKIPHTLIDQLDENGRIVIPVQTSGEDQTLVTGIKEGGKLRVANRGLVQFVPLIGRNGFEIN